MALAKLVSEHIYQVFFGGNWTDVNLKDSLKNLDWKKATQSIGDCNSIALLVFHIHFYVAAQLRVLQGKPLDTHDRFAFDMPTIENDDAWQALKKQCFNDAEQLSKAVAAMSDEILLQPFTDAKYGTYYRNLQGMAEHTHYHLGQIILLRKMIDAEIRL